MGFLRCVIFLQLYYVSIGLARRRMATLKHSELLQDIISNYVTNNMNETSKSAQILKNITDSKMSPGPGRTLDAGTLNTLVTDMKRDYKLRADAIPYYSLFVYEDEWVFGKNDRVVNKSLDLMRHSIYGARRKIQETKPYRRDTFSFKIGALYGKIKQLGRKLDSLFMTITRMPYQTHLIWFLVLYEKIIATGMDMEYAAEQVNVLYHKAEEEELKQRMNEQAAKIAGDVGDMPAFDPDEK